MLEGPPNDKMMHAAPAKKGFHFASDGVYQAAYIEAETIETATAIYHQTKRLINPASDEQPAASSTATKPKKGGADAVK